MQMKKSRADGGYLFLDEVHNLSAENQEKLFLFIDSQKYRMLGDSKNWQTAKVRLLFATTEDIHSTLLATFRRRIPFEIRIPDFWSGHMVKGSCWYRPSFRMKQRF